MAENGSSEALQVENPKAHDEEEEGEEGEEEEEEEEFEESEDGEEEGEDEAGHGELRVSELRGSVPTGEAVLRKPHSETLAAPSSLQLSENNQRFQVNSTSQSVGGAECEDQVGISKQGGSASIAAQPAEPRTQNKSQVSVCPTSSELSPTSVTQSISSLPSRTLREQRLSQVKDNNEGMPKRDQHGSSGVKPISVVPVVKTPSSDGYNWRKYGQKQVKSPKGSRSYYKCTFSECCAKKIECSDHSGRIIEIVYKSLHSHDPPRKINCVKENKLASSSEPMIRNSGTEHPIKMLNGSEPSTALKETIQETPPIPDRKRQNSDDSNGSCEIKVKEEYASSEAEPKKRVKKSNLAHSGSAIKSGKKPKFVVHAAGDVGISGDGYRWRKYGQKMVKGNPHPRNYYRCTSAGCPVRKHIETAVDNASAVIITYKGVHDHDMPVPKKRHGPPSAPLVAAAAPASMNNLQLKKADTLQNQVSSTQWSVDTEGELTGEAMELGGEKAMESARTLLSIGFEIKPC